MRPALFSDAELRDRVGALADRLPAGDEDEQVAAEDRGADREVELPARRQILAIEEHVGVDAFERERGPLRELALLVGVADEDLHRRHARPNPAWQATRGRGSLPRGMRLAIHPADPAEFTKPLAVGRTTPSALSRPVRRSWP